MVTVDKCCVCLRLSTGAIILGCFGSFTSLLLVIVLGGFLLSYDNFVAQSYAKGELGDVDSERLAIFLEKYKNGENCETFLKRIWIISCKFTVVVTILSTYVVLQAINFVSSLSLVCGTINVSLSQCCQRKCFLQIYLHRNGQNCWLPGWCRKRFSQSSGFLHQFFLTISIWHSTQFSVCTFGSVFTRCTNRWASRSIKNNQHIQPWEPQFDFTLLYLYNHQNVLLSHLHVTHTYDANRSILII